MIPRFLLRTLLGLFVVLIVTFSVLMGGYGIAAATGDGLGARVLWWLAMSCLILFVVDCLLLVGTLGFIQIERSASGPDRSTPSDRSADPPPS